MMSLAAGARSLYSITSAAASRRVPRIWHRILLNVVSPERRGDELLREIHRWNRLQARMCLPQRVPFSSRPDHDFRGVADTAVCSLRHGRNGRSRTLGDGHDEEHDQHHAVRSTTVPHRDIVPPLRKPARDQTKVGRSAVLRESDDANQGNARLLSMGKARGMPMQTQAAHIFGIRRFGTLWTPCRCSGEEDH